jgi:protoporphyrinogen oxidase
LEKPAVLIIGAGPAGLTAALELVRDGRMRPVILESSGAIGGLSRTVDYKGNRIDIGGHRFFSKSDWVMNWWRELLPLAANTDPTTIDPTTTDPTTTDPTIIAHRKQNREVDGEDTVRQPDTNNNVVMHLRKRISRIYFLRRYFDYPIKLNRATLENLGAARLLHMGISYAWTLLFPRREAHSLEDFLVNRFGSELYRVFFKDYTEKVWGVPCHRISAAWGAQRIKSLSVSAAIRHALNKNADAANSDTRTSLIEHFLYPRLGPGQLWQEAALRICAGGGEIRLHHQVSGIRHEAGRVTSVLATNALGQVTEFAADHVISTMPVKDLVAGLQPPAPAEVGTIAAALPYRDFITVGLLLSRMRANPQSQSTRPNQMPPDNWIYIQEPDVRIGRLQIFNNWSDDMVANPDHIWLGLEYFCQENDALWTLSDQAMLKLAIDELTVIGMIDQDAVLDGTVIRVPKAYPAYFGAYEQFPQVREWLDGLDNLYLVGRNGMHRYNNQDHSMLTAKLAVAAILDGKTDKTAIWAVNIDDDYHESVTSNA